MDKDEFFNRVYDVLVEHCNAHPDSHSRSSFVFAFTRGRPPTEYRFMGALGFGGKFRFPRFVVDCYREDTNPKTDAMIAAANVALASLRAEYEATQHNHIA